MSVREKISIAIPTEAEQLAPDKAKAKRELGQVKVGELGTSTDFLNVAKTYLAKAAAAASQPQLPGASLDVTSRAFMHPHFNQVAVDKTNLGQSGARAMRGDPSILDLKRVVVAPPAEGITPEPTMIGNAIQKMGLKGDLETSMAGLLGQQASWAQQQGMTLEKLKQRLAELRQMIELRRKALARQRQGSRATAPPSSVTLEQAAWAEQGSLDQYEDVVEAGTLLIDATRRQAAMLHFHIGKLMGIKPKP